MRKLTITISVALLVLASACSSTETVSSGSGPSTSTAAADNDSSTTMAESADLTPKNSPALYLSGQITVPEGESGLSLVFVGVARGSSSSQVPVIVRNNTSDTLNRIEVTGTARDASGTLIGSGSSTQGFEPANLAPGEWGFGYVYFSEIMPEGTTYDLTAKGDKADTGIQLSKPTSVTIAEVSTQPQQYGGQSFIGIVSNDTGSDVEGPIGVDVGCFDASSNLIAVFGGYTEGSTDTLRYRFD